MSEEFDTLVSTRRREAPRGVSRVDAAMMDRWEVAYRELKGLILSGELRPSDRVREVELAERFGVSRGPIREALRVLETEGLIVRRARQGSYVMPMDTIDVREIYELRMALEPLAIRLSLQRNPASLTRALRDSLSEMQRAFDLGDYGALAAADLHLHSQFYIWCENERILGVWDSLRSPLQLLVVLTGGHDRSDWASVIRGHEPIVSAAVAGDIESCIKQENDHLRLALERVARFQAQPPGIVKA